MGVECSRFTEFCSRGKSLPERRKLNRQGEEMKQRSAFRRSLASSWSSRICHWVCLSWMQASGFLCPSSLSHWLWVALQGEGWGMSELSDMSGWGARIARCSIAVSPTAVTPTGGGGMALRTSVRDRVGAHQHSHTQ